MRPAIATTTLGGSLPERLAAIKTAGFEAVELFVDDLDRFDGTPADLGGLVSRTGIALANYFPLRDFEGMPEARRSEVYARVERYLDCASEMGAEMIMLCSNTDAESLSDTDRLASDLHTLGDLAAERGLKVAYEALAWGLHIHDYRKAADLIEKTGHRNVGLVLDTFHICARRLETASVADIPAERIFNVQISDSHMMPLDYLEWSRNHRVLPDQGEFALGDFVAALKKTGYAGMVSLECFNEELRTAPPARVAAAAFASLTRLWG